MSIMGFYVFHVAVLAVTLLCVLKHGCLSMKQKRQMFYMPNTLDSLRAQIQSVERSLLECRRRIELLTGKAQVQHAKANVGSTGIGNWGWIGFIDDRRRKRSVRIRQVPYFNYYWNGQYYQLQNTLNTLNSEYSQCNANLQKTLATQQQINDKEQLAKQLLQEIEVGATNLRSCVNSGGRTDLDLQSLTNYINNGGFVPVVPAQTRPQVYQAPPPAPPIWWMYRFDDRRREVVASISQMIWFKS
ncbi:uncharacterized protein LOC131952685 [Physella acuta]|uniref:uncharacterized protein LOC131952685 n=1 Tax=Physella acuta TaxID=109671 RepID=UPI0027DB57B5|nr:uncharacterized protein LOC131952685 [Physella acuta]